MAGPALSMAFEVAGTTKPMLASLSSGHVFFVASAPTESLMAYLSGLFSFCIEDAL
jgi:hypothetical protein